MQLLSATPDRAHQIGRLQDPDVLRSRLPRHVQVLAELAQRLPVPLVQQVEQLSAGRVAQRFENLVSVHPLRSCVRGLYAGKYLHVKQPIGLRAARWGAAILGNGRRQPAPRTYRRGSRESATWNPGRRRALEQRLDLWRPLAPSAPLGGKRPRRVAAKGVAKRTVRIDAQQAVGV